jgi:hypothetical protein
MNIKKEISLFKNSLKTEYHKIVFTVFFEFLLILIFVIGSRFVLIKSLGIQASPTTILLFGLLLIVALLVVSFIKSIIFKIITEQKYSLKLYLKFLIISLIWSAVYLILVLIFKGTIYILFGDGNITGVLTIILAYILPLAFMIFVTLFSTTTFLYTAKNLSVKSGLKSIFKTSIVNLRKIWPVFLLLVIFAIFMQLIASPLKLVSIINRVILFFVIYHILAATFTVYYNTYLEKKKLY